MRGGRQRANVRGPPDISLKLKTVGVLMIDLVLPPLSPLGVEIDTALTPGVC